MRRNRLARLGAATGIAEDAASRETVLTVRPALVGDGLAGSKAAGQVLPVRGLHAADEFLE